MADKAKICRWLVISLCICSVRTVLSERITEKIYDKIDYGFSCFRRLNGTHQIGCSSKQSGNVGVVHLVEGAADVDWVVDAGPHPPYAVLMWPDVFRRENVIKLKNSGKISGILVLNGTLASSPPPPSSYSNDFTCPNKYSSVYTSNYSSYCETNPWNPWGDGLLFEDLDFPVFFINETKFNQSILLDDCYYKFNQPLDGALPDYPLCSVELKSFMWASVDTPTCMRRGRLNMLLNPQPSEFCDPLGSFNLYAPVLPRNKSDGSTRERSVIFLAARMDSASIFDNLALGADTAITGMVTLIAVSEMLQRLQADILEAGKVDNIFSVLFQGEAFDYIGSSRMVYDMMGNKFPHALKENKPSQGPLVGLNHISHFIELGSLAPKGQPTIYAHVDPISMRNINVANKVDDLLRKLRAHSEDLTVEKVDRNIPLPPSSFQSFLKKDGEIPGVVITNHKTSFTNRFYNSERDDPNVLPMSEMSRHLAGIARTVAAAIYEIATTKNMSSQIQPNITLVDSLLECFMIDANCTLFNSLLNYKSSLLVSGPLTTYVGVQQGDDAYKPLIVRTRHLMALVTGQVVGSNRSACFGDEMDEIFHFYWMGESESDNVTGLCYKSTVKASPAVSPAFEIPDYDWTSGEYSTWTESRWESFGIRIFLKPSPAQEWMVFSIGLVTFFISIVATFWINKKADVLFPNSIAEGVC